MRKGEIQVLAVMLVPRARESKKGRTEDALALWGEEGRDKLR